MVDKYKLVLVDDHRLFLDSLKFVLQCDEHIEIVAEAYDGEHFLEILQENQPDLVLMDISMPGMDGIEATRRALSKYPELKIIALSMFSDEVYYRKMIEAGVKGFILKESESEELIRAIETVINGEYYFAKEILDNVIVKFSSRQPEEEKLPFEKQLSSRELEILQFICEGLSNKEIADKLSISQRTVEGHRSKILSKTEAKNSIQLLLYAIRNTLIEI